jgi:WXG100 protein secretion system (Wss), protein YukD
MSTHPPKKITVTVIVSSVPVTVTLDHNARVEHLVREALKEAGQKDPDIAEWQLRNGDSKEFKLDEHLVAAGIVDGETLFLNKGAGGGG